MSASERNENLHGRSSLADLANMGGRGGKAMEGLVEKQPHYAGERHRLQYLLNNGGSDDSSRLVSSRLVGRIWSCLPGWQWHQRGSWLTHTWYSSVVGKEGTSTLGKYRHDRCGAVPGLDLLAGTDLAWHPSRNGEGKLGKQHDSNRREPGTQREGPGLASWLTRLFLASDNHVQ